jgi:hypothetical protein
VRRTIGQVNIGNNIVAGFIKSEVPENIISKSYEKSGPAPGSSLYFRFASQKVLQAHSRSYSIP